MEAKEKDFSDSKMSAAENIKNPNKVMPNMFQCWVEKNMGSKNTETNRKTAVSTIVTKDDKPVDTNGHDAPTARLTDFKEAFKAFKNDGDGELSYAEVSEDTYLRKQIKNHIDVTKKDGKNEFNDVQEIVEKSSSNTSTSAYISYGEDIRSHSGLTELNDIYKKSNHLSADHKINTIIEKDDVISEVSSMDEIPRNMSNLGLVQEIKLITEKERTQWTNCISTTTKFYLMAVGMPLFFALLYSIAIFFPPGARDKAPVLLWTNGELETYNGKLTLCPSNKPNICSEGVSQIILVAIARLVAFASYGMVGFVFVSKMHSTIHFLSSTIFSQTAPIENMHRLHSIVGMIYGYLVLVHVIAHIVRWSMRGEIGLLVNSSPGLSGIVGMLSMIVVILSMTLAKRFQRKITFEARSTAHWCFTLLVLAMAFHTPRCRIIVCLFL